MQGQTFSEILASRQTVRRTKSLGPAELGHSLPHSSKAEILGIFKSLYRPEVHRLEPGSSPA
jgi:hypothetical protein